MNRRPRRRRGTALHGARVLVTGGGSGLGRRLALDSAARGAELVLWDLDLPAAESVAAEIRAAGGVAAAQGVNVADQQAVAAAAGTAGGVDVLINNAGVVTGRPLLEAGEEQIRRTMEVNVLALFWTTRALLPGMLDRGRGTVVTIASAAGWAGVSRQTDYSTSKWAAVGFTESLRNELRTAGHRVSTLVVCPYYIDTGMFDGVTTRFPRLLPILLPEDVSRRTLDAIEAGEHQVMMPWMVRTVPLMRVLPPRMFDRVMDLFGMNHAMDRFTGRAGGGST